MKSSTSPNTPTLASKRNDNSEDGDGDGRKTSQNTEKPTFRSMVRQYGPVFIGTYLTVYVSTVFGLFMGIESGLMDPAYLLSFIVGSAESGTNPTSAQTAINSVEIIKEWLGHYPWTQPAAPYVERYPWAANLGVAWVATKFTEPIRFGVTVAILPKVARSLGYTKPSKKDEP
jgi:hypothetical protein